MDKDTIKKELADLIEEVLPEIDGDVSMTASIENQYGVNSISIIRLIVAAESKFKVQFTDYELALSSYQTFGDLAEVIAEKLDI
jgi:acyl carrier protein